MSAIETDGLVKYFGDRKALNGVTCQVPAGGVVGLVGPNGSGKSTLIRVLLGLLRPSAGSASVLGQPVDDPSAYLGRVGALIEGPAFVPALSARANLASLAKLRGIPAGSVEQAVRAVGLQGRDGEPVRRFSLGMKQRLGIAAAMLADPQLLILDEPTNGLDPAGIVDVRALVRELGTSGRTVLVSSHQLGELEAVCDRLVVIRFGDLVFDGPTQALLARGRSSVLARPEVVADLPLLAERLSADGWGVEVSAGAVRVDARPDQGAQIHPVAVAAGVTLAALVPKQESLEDIFLALTGSDGGELGQHRAETGRAA